MGMNISSKPDYSYLFQSLSNNNSSSSSMGNLNFLSDYASIKNGSYTKLLKAYYAKTGDTGTTSSSLSTNTNKQSISTAADSAKTLSGIEKAADDLKESADALITKGSKSVFTKKNVTTTNEDGFENTTKEYDTDAIYKAVSQFAQDYNSLVDKAGDSNTQNILSKTESLVNMTKSNEKLLSQIGITIQEDNTLSIDEETFKKADMNTAKSLFNGSGSYAYRVSAQASLIDYAASRESSKANTYTGSGTYSNVYSSGNLLDMLY